MAAILVGVLLSAWTTEMIGIHAIFGAFLSGRSCPRSPASPREITERLEDMTVLFLLPIFFAVVGLSTRIGLLDRGVSCGWLAAADHRGRHRRQAGRFDRRRRAPAGTAWRSSTALGILMNSRGLTEIVILTIGRSLGVISPALFTIMVLMALVTTFMTTPLLAASCTPSA